MQLEAGMYVRTKAGVICKVLEKKYDGMCELNYYILDRNCEWTNYILYEDRIEKYIIKTSYNIIDLIEVGDYVNRCLVEEVEIVPNEEVYKVARTTTADGYDGETESIYKEDIKTIVTKEQFEAMEYRIGD